MFCAFLPWRIYSKQILSVSSFFSASFRMAQINCRQLKNKMMSPTPFTQILYTVCHRFDYISSTVYNTYLIISSNTRLHSSVYFFVVLKFMRLVVFWHSSNAQSCHKWHGKFNVSGINHLQNHFWKHLRRHRSS